MTTKCISFDRDGAIGRRQEVPFRLPGIRGQYILLDHMRIEIASAHWIKFRISEDRRLVHWMKCIEHGASWQNAIFMYFMLHNMFAPDEEHFKVRICWATQMNGKEEKPLLLEIGLASNHDNALGFCGTVERLSKRTTLKIYKCRWHVFGNVKLWAGFAERCTGCTVLEVCTIGMSHVYCFYGHIKKIRKMRCISRRWMAVLGESEVCVCVFRVSDRHFAIYCGLE